MKKNLFHPSLKGIAFALPLFLLFACCSSSVFAQPATITQSNCYTITEDTSHYVCDTMYHLPQGDRPKSCNVGGNYGNHNCTYCKTFRICMDKCTGLNPTTFTVTSSSSTDCHNVCSQGDFNIFDQWGNGFEDCSWLNPRVMVSVISTGIPDLQCVKFTICRAIPPGVTPIPTQTYTISLPAGTSCGGVACGNATITF